MQRPVLSWLFFIPSGMGDIVANVVAYIPIGLLLRLCLREGFKNFAITVAAGSLLSLMVEILQNATTHRDPSYIDVETNTFGTFAGALIATWFRKPLLKAKFLPRVALAQAVLLGLWIAMHALPLVPALEMYTIRRSLAGLDTFRFTIEGLLRWTASYLIFAELIRAIAPPKRFLLWFAGALGTTYACRLVIQSQILEWNEVLGTLIALPLILIAPRTGKPAWIVLLVLIAGAGLAPFRFDALERQPFYWLQFETYAQLAQKMLLAIGATWVGYRAGLNRFAAGLAAATVLFAVEYGQAHMSPATRVPEYADPLLALSAILILERK